MPNTTAGNTWNLPNYFGNLFTADSVSTPFLSMIGGLTGGLQTENFEFATDSLYEHESLAQKSITETASLTAPTAISYVRAQTKNVTQIFHEKVSISYVKMSNRNRLSGIATAGASPVVVSEKDFQIARALEKIAREVEWHFLQGTYAISAAVGQPNQTRGMIELCAGKSTVDGGAAWLSKAIFESLLQEMFNNGALFKNMVIFCGGVQKTKLSDIYGYAPTDRNVGGVNVKQIETDFGNIAIAKPHRFMPAATLLIADMSVIAPVSQPVPEKGNFFYEPLSKTGAAEEGQIFGQMGLDHGPAFMHGSLTNLKTA